MQVLISIDDTDNIHSRGTGSLASLLAGALEERTWGICSHVTRHQLLVHPDIPYTSHNSAMCFAAEINDSSFNAVTAYAGEFLQRESAEGSDPGLCIVAVGELSDKLPVIEFGRRAKETVVTMKEAYDVAGLCGVHLSAHGGSGQGVIGALAGAGLRLSGSDGRMQGSLKIRTSGGRVTVSELRSLAGVDDVRSICGAVPDDGDLVLLGDKVKTVMLEGKAVLLLERLAVATEDVGWQTCSKQRLRSY
jgi:hypothetical protein